MHLEGQCGRSEHTTLGNLDRQIHNQLGLGRLN